MAGVHDISDITLCTVSFGHARHLRLNHALTRQLNPRWRGNIRWLVAENAPPGTSDRLTAPGGPFDLLDVRADASLGASHHHAGALNALLSRVRTRFVLCLDPDFYILCPDWLTRIPSHMSTCGLAFFGAPWHPRYVENYRYFPAVHCMFIDTDRIRAGDLDFRPLLPIEMKEAPAGGPVRAWLERRRRRPWDTGTRIFLRFANDEEVGVECVTPYYDLRRHWLGPGDLRSLRSRMVESLLPDRFRYVPRRRDSYATEGFRDRGLVDFDVPIYWEELFWRDAPFGLHVRRSYASPMRDSEREFHLLESALGQLGAHRHRERTGE